MGASQPDILAPFVAVGGAPTYTCLFNLTLLDPMKTTQYVRNRGLYEQDKLSFKLILALKILLTARRLEQSDVTLFIKGGAALDLNAVRPKPYLWLADPAWLNAIQLSRDNVLFKVKRWISYAL